MRGSYAPMGSRNSELSGSMNSAEFVNFWGDAPVPVAQNLIRELQLQAIETSTTSLQNSPPEVSSSSTVADNLFTVQMETLFKQNPSLFQILQGNLNLTTGKVQQITTSNTTTMLL